MTPITGVMPRLRSSITLANEVLSAISWSYASRSVRCAPIAMIAGDPPYRGHTSLSSCNVSGCAMLEFPFQDVALQSTEDDELSPDHGDISKE